MRLWYVYKINNQNLSNRHQSNHPDHNYHHINHYHPSLDYLNLVTN
jgi:hypothetical protein